MFFSTERGFMRKYIQIGERLKELRGDLSQEEFAKEIGVSHKGYQRYESGERVPHPHVLSKIAEKFDTTVDWILTGNLNIEKAIILEWAKKSHHLEDLADELEGITTRILKLKVAEAKENATEEELEKISKIVAEAEDEKKFLDLVRKRIADSIEDALEVKHFDQISQRSPLYSIFRQIEKIFNKGEKAKIDAIKTLLTAFESNKDDVRAKIDVLKAFVSVFEPELQK